MIVADTNVIAGLWVPNDTDELVYKLLEADPDWVAPLLWRSEFRNVTTKYLRAELLSFSTIIEATNEAEALMKDKEFEVNSTHVLQLVSQSNCSSYDCEFVALAEDLDVKLATFDKKICREFPDIALPPQQFFSE
jgi:predicted nucleic acid-binding protein